VRERKQVNFQNPLAKFRAKGKKFQKTAAIKRVPTRELRPLRCYKGKGKAGIDCDIQ